MFCTASDPVIYIRQVIFAMNVVPDKVIGNVKYVKKARR